MKFPFNVNTNHIPDCLLCVEKIDNKSKNGKIIKGMVQNDKR